MTIIVAIKDLAEGLRRGLGLYFTERPDHMLELMAPRRR